MTKISAEKRRFSRNDIRWMPTIDGKVMAFRKFPFSGYATRREAVAAAKAYQEAEDEKTARMCGWVQVEEGGVKFVMHPEHGWMAPDWATAVTPGFKAARWLQAMRVRNPEFFA